MSNNPTTQYSQNLTLGQGDKKEMNGATEEKFVPFAINYPMSNGQDEDEKAQEEMKENGIEVECETMFLPKENKEDVDDWDESDEEIDRDLSNSNWIGKTVVQIQKMCKHTNDLLKRTTKGYFTAAIFLLGYAAYFIIAMVHDFGDEPSVRLLVCTILGVIIATRHRIRQACGWLFKRWYGAERFSDAHRATLHKARFFTRWLMYGVLTAVSVYVLIDEGRKDSNNLRSLPGLFLFLLVCLLFSTHPSKVNWHTVYWGFGLQFLTALLTLKWKTGQDMVLWVQNRFDEFFANSKASSRLMFGETYMDHYFVFGAMPIVFLTNATLTMLYYVGAMQFLIKSIGSFLCFVLNTSPVESMSVAAGIFLEGITSILSLRPYLDRVSKSELFLIITSVFASLGGAYLAILSTIGVSLEYLIPAMVVSAPATFAVCKLMVPETRNMAETYKELAIGDEEKKKYTNIFDAAQTGATSMLALIGNVVTVSFAFFSYIEWINNTLEWFGDRVGITKLSIELISSYLLYPVALAMGIEPEDCRNVAMLLGYRIGINNIIAFFKLTDLKINKAKYDNYMLSTNWTGTITRNRDEVILDMWNVTLKHGFISKRSEAIITYCLCGFSSCFTVAVVIGIMYTLLPQRKVWISKMALSALIAGNIANCMTGCFASLFY